MKRVFTHTNYVYVKNEALFHCKGSWRNEYQQLPPRLPHTLKPQSPWKALGVWKDLKQNVRTERIGEERLLKMDERV